MKHFAKIDSKKVVQEVLVVSEDKQPTPEAWLKQKFGGTWLETCPNTQAGVHFESGEPFRKNFAGLGYSYDSELDAFIPPKTYESWVLNPETGTWKAPLPLPDDAAGEDNPDGVHYFWDEENISWQQVETP